MRKYIVLWFITIGSMLSCITPAFAYDFYHPQSEQAYNNFIKKISSRSINQQSDTITELHILLLKIQKRESLSSAQQGLISDLLYLNSRKKLSLDIKIKNISESEQKENIQNIFSDYSTQSTLNKFPIRSDFNFISSNTDHIFLKDDIWYAYIFSQFSYFEQGEDITYRDLVHNGIDGDSDLLFVTQEGKLGVTKDYFIVELANHSDIKNYDTIYDILLALKKDQTKIVSDTKNTLPAVQKITQQLTAGKTKEQKIQSIYGYILEHIQYTENIDLNDRKIFSGIETFNNNDGVCEGYTALFYYMLQFAGIDDVEVIYGDVIDSADFPNIGHAWVRIGNYYYDPTFDDPVGTTETKTFDEYKYYQLPRDLFYTNRYDYGTTPESLKTTSLEYRKVLIQKNIFNLTDTYKNKEYILLKQAQFKKSYGYSFDQNITLQNYSKIAPIYEVVDYKYNDEEGRVWTIQQLRYFPVENNSSNLEAILEQIDYNPKNYIMFAWKMDDGSYEYRLGYNIKYY